MEPLKTAVLGLQDKGELLLEAAICTGKFKIQAVADKDINLSKKAAVKLNCDCTDDYRQLVTQNNIDCLLIAAGTYSCDEHIRTAIKKKFNIFKIAPVARNFNEASELVQLAEAENIKFAIANPRRFAQSLVTLRDLLSNGGITQVFLIDAVCFSGDQIYPSWQNDIKQSGGGVIIHNCYEIIDLLINNFGLPQKVYTLSSHQSYGKQQIIYQTEDTAVLNFKFTDTLFGSLTASRRPGTGPKNENLIIYGKDIIIVATDSKLSIKDGHGNVKNEFTYDDELLEQMQKSLENFALSILEPGKTKLLSSGRQNLKNMAVIESAYLSARTGMPEQPERILEIT
jgi:predicted dehydrogenase